MWNGTRLALTVLGFLATAGGHPGVLAAQEPSDLCPNAADDKAAIIGLVQDADGGMVLPGASVVAAWSADGVDGRAEVQVGLDGTYTLCGVPQNTEISLHARFTQFAGAPIVVSLSGGIGRQDLAVSLTAAAAVEEEPRPEVVEAAHSARSKAFSARDIRRDDLEVLPPMSVYELLRQHSYVQVEPGSDNIYLSGRGHERPALVYINNRRVGFPVEVSKTMQIDQVTRIELLTPGEGGARFGGDGLEPIIAVTRR